MTRDNENSKNPIKRVLHILGIVLIAISAFPCLLAFINIPPVIQYAIQNGNNAALQIYIPLVIAGVINGLGLIALVVSLLLKEKRTMPL